MHTYKIAVLLCTLNGEKFIDEQIQSILNQTYQNFTIFISDDGSSDKTLVNIQRFNRYIESGKIQISSGPAQGFGKNFISNLISHIDDADFFCYCDQDDIWNARKLEHSLNILLKYKNEPALYCSVTNLISEKGNLIGISKYKNVKPNFKNALCQSLAGGNTMMFNKNAALLFRFLPKDIEISSHDWVTYLVIASVNGKIFYDKVSYISYRQHSNNLVGDNQDLKSKLIRFSAFYNGVYRKWNKQNIRLLSTLPNFSKSNNKIFSSFKKIHSDDYKIRIRVLFKFTFYRCNFFETILFYIGLIFKLI
jgi:glycosyltransferase involved in cell wall biosynthesis